MTGPVVLKPRQHQQELIDFHFSSGALGTFGWHGMGLGKTLSALWIWRAFKAHLRSMGITGAKFMVILPKSAVSTWRDEAAKNAPDLNNDMLTFPYSQLHYATKRARASDVRFVVMDESHYLKSPDTNRIKSMSAFLMALASGPGRFQHGRFLMLTGTPMPNGANELYTTWAMCAAGSIEEAAARLLDEAKYDEWKKLFAIAKEVRWESKRYGEQRGNDYSGVKNEQMLNQIMNQFTHFRRVSDCIDLPESIIHRINLGLTDDKLLENADITRPEAFMSLQERLARAKEPHLYEWVDEFVKSSSEQLVIFSMYTWPLYKLKEKFGNKIVIITGKEKDRDRTAAIHAFQRGEVQIIAMSYKCGSEALNLQNAYISLYHGYPWHYAALSQAMARTARSGQKRTTLHYFLLSGENDVRIFNLVDSKRDATERVEEGLLALMKTGFANLLSPPIQVEVAPVKKGFDFLF